jgi:hypothetical protein
MKALQTIPIEIPQGILSEWQSSVDVMAKVVGVPAGLIMRIVQTDIEVFVSSNSDGNPYARGDREEFLGSGLYCETVINRNKKLLVPNALTDENWKANPDVKLNMISYLGFPILWPGGEPFGTICVLDSKENAHSETAEELMLKFRGMIQSHLELLYMNHILGEENRSLTDYLAEIQTLRGIVPICSFCKKMRDDKGYWEAVDTFISRRTEAKFSHGFCPDCAREHYALEIEAAATPTVVD